MPHRSRTIPCVAVALLALMAAPARADAIDGDWCRPDGKQMTIHGPQIVTPGGQKTQGDYGRHHFVYVIPAGEAGAGDIVSIILRGEYLALARQGGADAPLQEWKRCANTVS